MQRWSPLAVLAAAQFVMVLDQAVMNVSISQLVIDLDTDVTAIQAVITLYSLVMAMFMIAGGKIGDLIGRRPAFTLGLVVYAIGSAITALAPSVLVLAIGWSVLEGLGAALVMPALAALIAGNYEGRQRAIAYSVIGAVAGAGIAVGPIVGGWATTTLSWRVVFVGEVVIVLGVLSTVRFLRDTAREDVRPRLDVVGIVLSALGLGLVVLGLLQAGTWGWLVPKNPPLALFGFAPTPFVVATGGLLLWLFVAWQRRRERAGTDPLVHLDLFRIPTLRAGLQSLPAPNLILLGVFFTIPLYLQLVLGLDALETGVRMLPVSVAMFVAAIAGARLRTRFAVRTVVRAGFGSTILAILWLLATVEPTLLEIRFALAMTLLGIGMGLIASQLGDVVQSSVDASGRSEAGGLQYTAMQLGSAVGVALIGAIVLSGLVSNFLTQVEGDPRVPPTVVAQTTIAVTEGVSFVSAEQVRRVATEAGLEPAEVDALVDNYAAAQLFALKSGLLACMLLALLTVPATRRLPTDRPVPTGAPEMA